MEGTHIPDNIDEVPKIEGADFVYLKERIKAEIGGKLRQLMEAKLGQRALNFSEVDKEMLRGLITRINENISGTFGEF